MTLVFTGVTLHNYPVSMVILHCFDFNTISDNVHQTGYWLTVPTELITNDKVFPLSIYDRINQECVYLNDEGIADMSIIVGLIGKDGIVLATDSRTTWQIGGMTYHNDNAKKMRQIKDNIGLMSYGYNSGYQHFLADYYEAVYVRDTNSNIETLKSKKELPSDFRLTFLETVQSFAKAIKNEVKPFIESYNSLKIVGGINFVLAGYDRGIPKIYSIGVNDLATPFVPSESERYYFGGVSEVGTYWVRKLNLANLVFDVAFLKRFAVMVVLETIKTSDMCGEPIQMAVIDSSGYHEVSNDVENIKSGLDPEQKWLFDYLNTQTK